MVASVETVAEMVLNLLLRMVAKTEHEAKTFLPILLRIEAWAKTTKAKITWKAVIASSRARLPTMTMTLLPIFLVVVGLDTQVAKILFPILLLIEAVDPTA